MLRPTLVEVREIANSTCRTQMTSANKNRLDPRLHHGYELKEPQLTRQAAGPQA
jgi:hypothetical protein